jgi:glycosyltransferase involved in cell wall biosynthesis
MMKELGHTVFLYTGEHNTAPCDEAICVITDEERKKWLGNTHYVHAGFGSDFAMWGETNKRMIAEIAKRKQRCDFICHVGGSSQQQVTVAHPDCMGVEFGVGYEGIVEKYIVFESQSWRQYCYGKYNLNDRAFDTTIHGYFAVEDFPMGDGKGDFLLYAGRMTPSKGMSVIAEIAKATNLPVKMIGLGDSRPTGCEYLGTVSIEERARLMGAARAVLVPTLYNEPFGSVVAEAQLCGTPVITTDHGSFPELVQNGVNGYRCNLLREFVRATANVKLLNRDLIRILAISKFSLGAAKPQYQAYFERLSTLWTEGWYSK